MPNLVWSYGVTTVPSRSETLLPHTLASLRSGGFSKPHLFVDGSRYGPRWDQYYNIGCGMTFREPAVNVAGNWVLSLYELYYREPNADRYALFQDDLVTYRNLRQYLEGCVYPDGSEKARAAYGVDNCRGYLNLYTSPANAALVPRSPGHANTLPNAPKGLGPTGEFREGWYLSNQLGRGAVALVFCRDAVLVLLQSRHLAYRPMDCQRGKWAIDGGIVTALAEADPKGQLGGPWREYCHYPSLVQHTGHPSTLGKGEQPDAPVFWDESFDALKLLKS